MSSFKQCSTAFAILMASSLPVLAQDGGPLRDRPEHVVVSVRGTDFSVRVPLPQAARLCDADANDLARSFRGTSEPVCSISRDEAEAIGVRFGRDDDDDDDDDDDHDDDDDDGGNGGDDDGDGNRGHGNDADGFDEDNPGNSRGVGGGRGQGNGNGNRGNGNND